MSNDPTREQVSNPASRLQAIDRRKALTGEPAVNRIAPVSETTSKQQTEISATKLPADSPTADASPPMPRKPKSSRVGRIVIRILLVLLVIEGVASGRVYFAKTKLTNELAKAEAENQVVTREAVKQLLGDREPDLSKQIHVGVGDELYDVYYYSGLLKRRVLCVHYGIQGETDADESQREMMEVLTVVPEAVLYEDAP